MIYSKKCRAPDERSETAHNVPGKIYETNSMAQKEHCENGLLIVAERWTVWEHLATCLQRLSATELPVPDHLNTQIPRQQLGFIPADELVTFYAED